MSEWAVQQGVHYQTAWRWVRDGQMPVPFVKTASGTILVMPDGPPPGTTGTRRVALYARVSSHDQRKDLDAQVARLSAWVAQHGEHVTQVVAEVGSGMNGRRAKVRRLLADPDVDVIVVEHRDRLARLNTELVEAALAAQGRELVVVDDAELDDDLVRDVTEVLTSFCARLYGRRGARNRAMRALTCAKNAPVGDEAAT